MQVLGLQFNRDKLKWLCNRWAGNAQDRYLTFQGSQIIRSDFVQVLGSVFRGDLNERAAIEHGCEALCLRDLYLFLGE